MSAEIVLSIVTQYQYVYYHLDVANDVALSISCSYCCVSLITGKKFPWLCSILWKGMLQPSTL